MIPFVCMFFRFLPRQILKISSVYFTVVLVLIFAIAPRIIFADEASNVDAIVTTEVSSVVTSTVPEQQGAQQENSIVDPVVSTSVPEVVGNDSATTSNVESSYEAGDVIATSTSEIAVSTTTDSTLPNNVVIDESGSSTPSFAATSTPNSSDSSFVPSLDAVSGASSSSVPTSTVPSIVEQDTQTGKTLTISATPEQELITPMVNIPVKTEIPEIFKIGQENQIQVKWQNNGNQEMQFTALDEDGNGYIDHIEWIVPHLSTQTFSIIYISHALQLDPNKNVIADIYDQVKDKDGTYAYLSDSQFVRATFEHILDNTKDITLYAKPHNEGSSVKIEVYTLNGDLVAVFDAIDHEGKYRVLLTNLSTSTDTFDLKIIGDVDIDQIIDPAPATAYWVGGTGNWSDAANHWASSSGGAPGAGNAPDATSNVVFDASSGGAATVVTIDSSATVGSMTISAYTGTIIQNANLTITNSGGQSGNYVQNSAVTFTATNPGTNTLTVTGSFAINAGTFRRYTGLGIKTVLSLSNISRIFPISLLAPSLIKISSLWSDTCFFS